MAVCFLALPTVHCLEPEGRLGSVEPIPDLGAEGFAK
jgi:hypothetical protein